MALGWPAPRIIDLLLNRYEEITYNHPAKTVRIMVKIVGFRTQLAKTV